MLNICFQEASCLYIFFFFNFAILIMHWVEEKNLNVKKNHEQDKNA